MTPRVLVTPRETATSEELFVRGQTALRQGRPEDASRLFDLIVQHDALGPWAARAYLRSGLAWEQLGDLQTAVVRFEEAARRFPESSVTRESLLRALRVRLHLGDWAAAAAVAKTALAQSHKATPSEAILAYAAQALAAVDEADRALADYFVGKGLAVVDRLGLDRAGRIPRDMAPLYYAQGEARRLRAAELPILRQPEGFAVRLEERCQALLAAQASYSDAMRAYDAHWSARAGLRVGELYESLHGELMQVPPPRAVDSERRVLFEGAMRLRYSILLRKAESMAKHTLALLERSEAGASWVVQAEQALQSIRTGLQREEAALDALPQSRATLREALRELERRAKSSSTSN